jgi:hypothetical protein
MNTRLAPLQQLKLDYQTTVRILQDLNDKFPMEVRQALFSNNPSDTVRVDVFARMRARVEQDIR